ncbi:ABC transporter permease [Microbacterium sp. 1P10UB]|uniref:ABC transporter permease n=1 Tax=unclassified Microbacterium TaxID=2609290 RepID=UPI0039A1E3C7
MNVSSWGKMWSNWGIPLVLVALIAIASIISPGFLSLSNVQSILRESAYLGIVACAMTIAIISGSFDLSVGAQLALVSVVTLFAYGIGGMGLAVGAALAAGVACGLVNAGLVVLLRIPAFVATLATLFIFRGIAYVLTANGPATLPYSESGSPFAALGSANLALVPMPFVLMVAVFALSWVLLRRTATGRRITAFGSAPVAARYSGISEARTGVVVFVLLGLSVGIAVLAYVTRVWTADGATQDGFELRVITAAVLGGASLQGGRGSLLGTFSAVLLIATLNDLMVGLGVEASSQRIVLGIVLIAALAIDGLRTVARDNGGRPHRSRGNRLTANPRDRSVT